MMAAQRSKAAVSRRFDKGGLDGDRQAIIVSAY